MNREEMEDLILLRKRGSEHKLGRLYRNVEEHKEHLLEDEKKLIERAAELERFQPTITRMEQTYPKPPPYTYGSYIQSPAYQSYKKYVDEKKRLEGDVEFIKRNVETRKELIRDTEELIREREEDIVTIDSANVFYKATKSHRRPYQDTQQRHESTAVPKLSNHESTAVSKLSNHGEGFRRKFASFVNAFQGQPDALERMGYPMKGGRRTRRKRIKK